MQQSTIFCVLATGVPLTSILFCRINAVDRTLTMLADRFQASPLQELVLKHNALTENGLRCLWPLMCGKHLKRLDLTNCGLDEDAMLVLENAMAGEGGILAASIEELRLGRNALGETGAVTIGRFVRNCSNLRVVDVSYIGAGDNSSDIAAGLRQLTDSGNHKLIYLDLSSSVDSATYSSWIYIL